MKRFNKKYVAGTTRVQLVGIDGWHKVTSINDTRVNITVDGLVGSFQVGHVIRYTNKD